MFRQHLSICAFAILVLLGTQTASALASKPTPVDRILAGMSLEEKVGQMILVYHSPYEFLHKHRVGGVLIMSEMLKRPEKLRAEIQKVQKELPIPLLVTIDQEGGKVNRLSKMKPFVQAPSAKDLSQWKPDKIRDYIRKVAAKLKHLGINTNLAPVLDPSFNSKNRKTYMEVLSRSFGKNPEEIVKPARAFIEGFLSEGIQCISKHFPGYDVETDSDFDIAVSQAEKAFLEKNIQAFSEVNESTRGIMMANILYEKINGMPAVLSEKLVKWARQVAGENLIITDDLWSTALRSHMLPGKKIDRDLYPDEAFARIVKSAVRAGNDMLMITYPEKVELMIRTILEMAKSDPKVLAHVEAAARRILMNKHRLSLI